MRLVQHPGTNLPLIEHPAQRAGAKLLRGDEEDARIAQPDPVQRVRAFRHRQQPVDGYAAADPAHFHPSHLVRHERDQGRDHHRQRAGLVVTRERRDLVAERLARAGGQNAQHMLARHRCLDDGLLHWTPVVVRWFGSKLVETEPALQLLAGIVPLAAPGAPGIGTGEVPESAHEVSGLRELMAHPGRHDRVAAGHREPRQRIGQRPAALLRLRQYLPAVGRAGRTLQAPPDRRQSRSLRRAGRLAELAEEYVQSAVRALGL